VETGPVTQYVRHCNPLLPLDTWSLVMDHMGLCHQLLSPSVNSGGQRTAPSRWRSLVVAMYQLWVRTEHLDLVSGWPWYRCYPPIHLLCGSTSMYTSLQLYLPSPYSNSFLHLGTQLFGQKNGVSPRGSEIPPISTANGLCPV
jgi:hypothetical protein